MLISSGMSNKKILLTNFFSLSSVQIANYLLPLLTIPYITRIIEPGNFGLINFASAFTGYFALITNFSFDLSVTREVSLNRHNKKKLQQIFNSVIIAKIILFIICTLIFILFILCFAKLQKESLLYFYTFIGIFGNIFFPTWFFQGMEKLSRVAFFNLIIRIFYTISIFLFIKNNSDYILIPFISSLVQIITSFLGFIYALSIFKLKIILPPKKEILQRFIDGWKIFISSLASNLYTTTNIIVLGIFVVNLYLGYFSAASKLINVIYGLVLFPISLSFFPHIGNLINNSLESGIILLKKLTIIVGGFTFIASVIIFTFAEFLIKIVFGANFLGAVLCLRIMAFLPFLIGLGNIFTVQALLNLKMDREFLKITIIGVVINIILNFLLVPHFLEKGSAMSWLITELFITVTSFFVLLKNNINLFDLKFLRSYLFNLKLKIL